MLAKASTVKADTVCFDLEDAVAQHKKDEARANVTSALLNIKCSQERLVRINSVRTELAAQDLQAVFSLPETAIPDGILVPKVETRDELQWVSQTIQKTIGPAASSRIALLALIESPIGVINLPQIVQLSVTETSAPKLEALVFGADDYASLTGARRSRGNEEVWYARNVILLHAAARSLQVIDLVQIDYHDEKRLEEECHEAAKLGYTGKQVIHPNQIEVVNRCFSPSSEVVENAKRIVDAYRKYQGKGIGAFSFDGKMMDEPTVKSAIRLIELSSFIEKRKPQ